MPRTKLPVDFNWEIYRALNPDLSFKFPWMYSSYFLRNGYRRTYHINQVYPEYNSDIYRRNYNDLQNLNNHQLQLHWIIFGKKECRNCSYLINHTSNEPINEQTNISLEETTNEPINEQTNISLEETTNEPINEQTNISLEETTNEPIIEQTNISLEETTNEPINEQTNISLEETNKTNINELTQESNKQNNEISNSIITNIPEEISIGELWNVIDKIFYINLNHRKDRDLEIRQEFIWAQIPPDKIERISAIQHNIGAIGCSSSHVKSLEIAVQMGLKNILILEDDFNFHRNFEHLKNSLNFLKNFNEEWDVILLAANVYQQINYNDYLNKVFNAQTTAGYLVNSKYFAKLLDNFRTGLNLFSKNFRRKYTFSIDTYWKQLQPIDKWYVFNPKLGYQRESYSNIEKKFVCYNC